MAEVGREVALAAWRWSAVSEEAVWGGGDVGAKVRMEGVRSVGLCELGGLWGACPGKAVGCYGFQREPPPNRRRFARCVLRGETRRRERGCVLDS